MNDFNIYETLEWHHIYPINDIKKHRLDVYPALNQASGKKHLFALAEDGSMIQDSLMCECLPILDMNNRIIIHNSFDCRESVMEAERILKD